MNAPRFFLPWLLFLVLSAPAEGGERLADRIVAVVDEDPIMMSDIRRRIGLGLVERRDGESDAELERRVLDALIDQRLRLHEVERHDFGQLPSDEVERQVERIRANFEHPSQLDVNLATLGLDEEGLELIVTRQLRVLLYVEKRLGPRVFIKREDIRTYYDDVLTPEMQRRSAALPPLDQVSDQIRDLLYEDRLNRQIEMWTEELRLQAVIDDYLERRERELPPIIERLQSPPDPSR